jgi:hypothetical protein
MARVAKTIEVDVPVRTAYNQWTQFEEFPRFMEGVESVTQLDDRRIHWKASIAGKKEEWDAEIREQVPDQKVIWRAVDGKENAGMVTFDQLGEGRTRVHLEMSYDPEGFVENVGDALGVVSRRVEGDLQRFKDYIEARGQETGAWRGEIHNPNAPGGHTQGAGSLDDRQGQKANLEGEDPSGRYQGQVETAGGHVDTSAGMRTPGAMRPGSLSREQEQRERGAYTDKDGYPES